MLVIQLINEIHLIIMTKARKIVYHMQITSCLLFKKDVILISPRTDG